MLVTTASKIIPVVNEAVSFLAISLCHFLCCSALPRGMKHVLRMTSDSVSSSSSCHYYFFLVFYKAFSAFLILWIVDFNSLSRHDFLRWLSLVVASSGHSFLLFLPAPYLHPQQISAKLVQTWGLFLGCLAEGIVGTCGGVWDVTCGGSLLYAASTGPGSSSVSAGIFFLHFIQDSWLASPFLFLLHKGLDHVQMGC